MSRVSRVSALARACWRAVEASQPLFADATASSTSKPAWSRALQLGAFQPMRMRFFADKPAASSATEAELQKADEEAFDPDYEHATGMERYEMEMIKHGIDPFDEAWRYNEKDGFSEDNPIIVPCATESRIIGIVDPDDDATIWWRELHVGDGPVQIIENSKWFMLQKTDQLPDDYHHDHH